MAPAGKSGKVVKKEETKEEKSVGKDKKTTTSVDTTAKPKKKKVKEVSKRHFPLHKLMKNKVFIPTKREEVPEWFVQMCERYNDGSLWNKTWLPADGKAYFKEKRRQICKENNLDRAKR